MLSQNIKIKEKVRKMRVQKGSKEEAPGIKEFGQTIINDLARQPQSWDEILY